MRTVLTEAVLVWKYPGVSVRMGRSYQVNMIRLTIGLAAPVLIWEEHQMRCRCLFGGSTYLSLPLWVYITGMPPPLFLLQFHF